MFGSTCRFGEVGEASLFHWQREAKRVGSGCKVLNYCGHVCRVNQNVLA
jgi:hypothetical protein